MRSLFGEDSVEYTIANIMRASRVAGLHKPGPFGWYLVTDKVMRHFVASPERFAQLPAMVALYYVMDHRMFTIAQHSARDAQRERMMMLTVKAVLDNYERGLHITFGEIVEVLASCDVITRKRVDWLRQETYRIIRCGGKATRKSAIDERIEAEAFNDVLLQNAIRLCRSCSDGHCEQHFLLNCPTVKEARRTVTVFFMYSAETTFRSWHRSQLKEDSEIWKRATKRQRS